MGGWMDGWVGKYLFFFCLLLTNYSIYHASYFWSPQKTFQDIFCEKMKKKSISKYIENRLTKRVYFPKKVLRISLYFDRFCCFRFFKHRFANLTKTTWDFFFCLFRARKIGHSEIQKFQNSENRTIGKSENRKIRNSENRKIGKSEVLIMEIGNLENRKVGKSENRKLENRKIGKLEN